MRKLWDAREARSQATARAAGVQVVDVDRASFEAAMKPLHARFLKDAQLQDLARRIAAVP